MEDNRPKANMWNTFPLNNTFWNLPYRAYDAIIGQCPLSLFLRGGSEKYHGIKKPLGESGGSIEMPSSCPYLSLRSSTEGPEQLLSQILAEAELKWVYKTLYISCKNTVSTVACLFPQPIRSKSICSIPRILRRYFHHFHQRIIQGNQSFRLFPDGLLHPNGSIFLKLPDDSCTINSLPVFSSSSM